MSTISEAAKQIINGFEEFKPIAAYLATEDGVLNVLNPIGFKKMAEAVLIMEDTLKRLQASSRGAIDIMKGHERITEEGTFFALSSLEQIADDTLQKCEDLFK